jgi:ATP-dependent Clp protease ATP-binding subunit ClpC
LKAVLDRESVRALIESVVLPGGVTSARDVTLPYTSRTYQVFALAKERALALGAREVGAEHVLLGVLREAKGIGGQVLAHYGLSETAVLEAIKQITPP